MRTAVTGGSGVVGLALLRHLVQSGHEVKALARSDKAASRIAITGARPIIGDLFDGEALARLLASVDWAFHVAGVNVLCPQDPGAMWRVNVAGTGAMIDACRRAGISRLVHTSSAVTIGEEQGQVGSETTGHRGHYLSHYERTKVEAERLALAGRRELDIVVVNPSSVQGPGRANGTGRLLLEACRGRLPLLVDATFSIVDIDDCARGHLLAAEQGQPGERYILSGSTLGTREAMTLLTRITGRVKRPRYLNATALRAIAGSAAAIWAPSRRQPPLCPETARVMLHGHRYDGTKATRELGLVYTPLEQTLTRVVDWYREEGLLA